MRFCDIKVANFHISHPLANTSRNGRKMPVKIKFPYNTKQNQLANEQRRLRVSRACGLVFHSSLEAMLKGAT